MKYGISFRNPTAEIVSELRERAAPLDSVVGKTIALMDIGKMRGDEFIDRLEQLCTERGIETRRYKKPTNTRVAPREMIKDIADNCDAVIIALSDCGSCTSCSTHDLNDLDKKGIAGVSVLTIEFQQAFESQKGTIGLDAAAVYVPHPLQNKTTAELHQWANAAVDKILQAIAHDTSRVTALETV
ncbi:UGSC family (seleno)protein [Bradyrhizobium sp. Pha-3]|uniref:UGSC family (seleno)protein n=1 Tax=Bradyrhizobium sp. Pha-3 TaxID=208375 RepID=UPI0035D505E7